MDKEVWLEESGYWLKITNGFSFSIEILDEKPQKNLSLVAIYVFNLKHPHPVIEIGGGRFSPEGLKDWVKVANFAASVAANIETYVEYYQENVGKNEKSRN